MALPRHADGMLRALCTGSVAGGEPSPVGCCGGPCGCWLGVEVRLGRRVGAEEADAGARAAAARDVRGVYQGASCCADWGTFCANNVRRARRCRRRAAARRMYTRRVPRAQHPLLAICCAHPLNPHRRQQRFAEFFTVMGVCLMFSAIFQTYDRARAAAATVTLRRNAFDLI